MTTNVTTTKSPGCCHPERSRFSGGAKDLLRVLALMSLVLVMMMLPRASDPLGRSVAAGI